MTVSVKPQTGAPSTRLPRHVRRLQMRIAKAHREGKPGKVKALQRILTHSYYAKLLAVKRVVHNKRTDGTELPIAA